MHQIQKSIAALAATTFLSASAVALAADPLGTLDVDGAYELRASGTSEFVRFDQSGATWYAGDTLRTRAGSAVLNLDAGGGLGFHEGSVATVAQAGDQLQIELAQGKLLYALPDAGRALTITAGNFTLSTAAAEAVRTNVDAGDEFVGAVQRLEDGNVRIEVRSGQLNVRNGNAYRVSVGAGEIVGLLNLPEAAVTEVQGGELPVVAPRSVAPTAQFEVTVNAPNTAGEYLVISRAGAPAGEFESVVTMGTSPVTYVDAPGAPGEYEVRVVSAASGAVLGSTPFTVTSPVAPALVGAGAGGGGALPWNTIFGVGAGAGMLYLFASEQGGSAQPVNPDPPPPPVSP